MAIENGVLKPTGVIQLRGGTAEVLANINPVLNNREIVVETDTGKIKAGTDGLTAWNDLPYVGGWLSDEMLTWVNNIDYAVLRNSVKVDNYISKEEAIEAISDGNFSNIWIGTRIKQNRYSGYIVLDFNYFHGIENCSAPHVVVAPYGNSVMLELSPEGFSSGGYYGFSALRDWLATQAEAAVNFFGEEHVLTHKEYLCDGITNGEASHYDWYDSQCELMTLQQVYGNQYYGSPDLSNKSGNHQFSYYRIFREALSSMPPYTLRDVASANSLWLADNITGLSQFIVDSEEFFSATPYMCIC